MATKTKTQSNSYKPNRPHTYTLYNLKSQNVQRTNKTCLQRTPRFSTKHRQHNPSRLESRSDKRFRFIHLESIIRRSRKHNLQIRNLRNNYKISRTIPFQSTASSFHNKNVSPEYL